MWGDNHTRKYIASTDGQSKGHSPIDCEDDGTWRRGDERETYDTCRLLMAHDGGQFGKIGKVTIELLPSNTNPEAWIPGARGANNAYADSYGKHTDNWHTRPEPPVEPIPEPPTPPVEPPFIPPDEPEPAKPGVTWQGWLGLGVILIVLVLLAIAIF
jgi:hypothetical protein